MDQKIQRTLVREEAYLKLREWILEGTLPPGAPLKDKELALQLGVSRTPIREALLRLEDEGMVQTKPNSSTAVTPIDFHNAFHLYSLVWTLECLALRQAFAFLTDADIQYMSETNARFKQHMKKKERFAALDADLEFHSIYIARSQNKELQKILSELKTKVRRLDLYYYEKIKNAPLSYGEHEEIIQALKQKNLPAALHSVESNWKNSFNRFNFKKGE